jgi:hypothetical protein
LPEHQTSFSKKWIVTNTLAYFGRALQEKKVFYDITTRLGSPLTMVKYEPKMFPDVANTSSIKAGELPTKQINSL